jgi:hypothetical protein
VYGPDKLRLDIRIPLEKLSKQDRRHVLAITEKYLPGAAPSNGLGIEIRYNFNPNDSARLRKDALFASLLRQHGLTPVYLIFSGISPRDEAIARLGRAGWRFLVADMASQFTMDLTTMDLSSILTEPLVRDEVNREIAALMHAIYDSSAFKTVLAHRISRDKISPIRIDD